MPTAEVKTRQLRKWNRANCGNKIAPTAEIRRCQALSFLMILTAVGDFAYQRKDGVYVVLINTLHHTYILCAFWCQVLCNTIVCTFTIVTLISGSWHKDMLRVLKRSYHALIWPYHALKWSYHAMIRRFLPDNSRALGAKLSSCKTNGQRDKYDKWDKVFQ